VFLFVIWISSLYESNEQTTFVATAFPRMRDSR
jgi:hypothetical protein